MEAKDTHCHLHFCNKSSAEMKPNTECWKSNWHCSRLPQSCELQRNRDSQSRHRRYSLFAIFAYSQWSLVQHIASNWDIFQNQRHHRYLLVFHLKHFNIFFINLICYQGDQNVMNSKVFTLSQLLIEAFSVIFSFLYNTFTMIKKQITIWWFEAQENNVKKVYCYLSPVLFLITLRSWCLKNGVSRLSFWTFVFVLHTSYSTHRLL